MLSIQNLTKQYDEFQLRDISLEIEKGEYFVLLGPSGAGKTVLFETIAGIIQPDSGKILFDERDITRNPIRNRRIGLVFQDGAVFPHLTAGQNISYPLKIKKLTLVQIREKVFSLAEQMGITHLLHRKPSTLSGGELRRVAIARTLALDPECLLLDEPLSSLDVQLQQEILDLLKNLSKSGLTILHITHNYREAFYLAHKMAVIDKGRIIQQGLPSEIVSHPRSKFVADFIGIKNYFDFKVVGHDEILVQNTVMMKAGNVLPHAGQMVIPQESITVIAGKGGVPEANTFKGKILDMVHFPDNVEITVDIGIPLHVVLSPSFAAALIMDHSVEVAVDPLKLDLFHP
jgi:ABC-type Fe3+/spermidine/putrescine transport system ATPase subunit